MVYIREAHPVGVTTDGRRQAPRNERDGVIVNDPKTIQERQIVAAECAKSLKIGFPVLLDNLDDAVERAYAGWPDRLYVIDIDGKVAGKGAPGPSGFKPSVDALPVVLERLLNLATTQNPQPTPQRPGFGGPMMQQMRERTGQMLTRMGLPDKEREATLAIWDKKFAAHQPVMQAKQELMMVLRDQSNVEGTVKALAAYADAVKKYTQQVDDLDKELEAAIQYSKKPQLQAALTAFGILGLNIAPPMQMGGPGGPGR